MDREQVIELLGNWKQIMAENKDYLIEIDSIVGDSDLGLTMSDGFAAAYEAAASSDEKDLGKLLYKAGKAMSTAVPSTMGTLMASGLMAAGKALRGTESLTDAQVAELFSAYLGGVQKLGKAKVGEKTFLDAMDPAVKALEADAASGDSLAKMGQDAADAAKKGFESTKGMLAVHGRAGGRGEASRELLDPGAAVANLLMQAFAKTVA